MTTTPILPSDAIIEAMAKAHHESFYTHLPSFEPPLAAWSDLPQDRKREEITDMKASLSTPEFQAWLSQQMGAQPVPGDARELAEDIAERFDPFHIKSPPHIDWAAALIERFAQAREAAALERTLPHWDGWYWAWPNTPCRR